MVQMRQGDSEDGGMGRAENEGVGESGGLRIGCVRKCG